MRNCLPGRLYLAFFLFVSTTSFSQDTPLFYYNLISTDSIKESVFILSSDSMKGRETGRRGQKMAAHYLASEYYSWNLCPGATNDCDTIEPQNELKNFLQDHPISTKNNKGRNLSINGENFLYGKDFVYTTPVSDTSLFINEILFIGINDKINLPSAFNDDRCKNRNILLFDAANEREGLMNFLVPANKRPSSLFIVTKEEKIKEIFYQKNQTDIPLPFHCIYISQSVAQKFFSTRKYDKTIKKTERRKKPVNIKLKCETSLGLVCNTEELRGQNIIAYIGGRDPDGETVVISSHYDHLGVRDSSVYFGADDNASGTSAVLELARVFSIAKKNGQCPKRNLLFLNVSGEEKGLLGSSWYVENPFNPIEKTIANLNIDMIGRIDPHHDSSGVHNYVYIIGSDKMSTELHTINEEMNRSGPNLELNYRYNTKDDPNQFYKRSDHFNFVKKGVPVIFYFNGTHKDYHKPTDTADKIDFELLTLRTRLVFLTAWELANRKDRVLVDKPNDAENK